MSNHPLGLSGEPFISPPTLSRRDATRLIRRRVSAVGGDGATLFPTETCDEIHRLAGGIPEAMFHLAREAMQVASEAKARSVSPAHVREAAGGAPVRAGADASTRDVAESSMALDETGLDAAEHDRADAVETPADDPARDESPVISAGFMLPNEPSEHLPQDTQAWVSRFLPSQGRTGRAPARVPRSARPGRGGHAGARVARAPTIHVPTPLDPGDIPGAADVAMAPATLARALPRHAPSRRRPRSRRGGVGGGIVSVAAIMCIVAVVVLQVRRGALNSDRETSHIVPTSGPARERVSTDSDGPDRGSGPKRNASDPPVEPERTPRAGATEPRSDHRGGANVAAEGTPGVVEKRGPEPSRDGTQPGATSPASASARRPATVASGAVTRPETPASRFGLEVATSIFEERARTERQRLAAAGYNVRLVTSQEYGSTVYCVVLGSYPQREAAERAADTLLSGGTVLQARIVTLPPEK